MNAMKLTEIVGVPFALIKDLTDGQNISFRTLERVFSATDWKKAKKDYEKKKKKAEKKEGSKI